MQYPKPRIFSYMHEGERYYTAAKGLKAWILERFSQGLTVTDGEDGGFTQKAIQNMLYAIRWDGIDAERVHPTSGPRYWRAVEGLDVREERVKQ